MLYIKEMVINMSMFSRKSKKSYRSPEREGKLVDDTLSYLIF